MRILVREEIKLSDPTRHLLSLMSHNDRKDVKLRAPIRDASFIDATEGNL